MPTHITIDAPELAPVTSLSTYDGTTIAVGQDGGRERSPLSLVNISGSSPAFDPLEVPHDVIVTAIRSYVDGDGLFLVLNNKAFARDERGLHPLEAVSEGAQAIERASRQNRLAVSGAKIDVFDAGRNDTLWTSPGEPSSTWPAELAATLTPSGEQLVAAGIETGTVLRIDLETGREVGRITGAPDQCRRLVTDLEGTRIAALERGGGIFVADLDTGEQLVPTMTALMTGSSLSVAFSPSGQLVAFGTNAGFVMLLSISDDNLVYSEPVHEARVWDLAFLDETTVVSAGGDGRVGVVDLA